MNKKQNNKDFFRQNIYRFLFLFVIGFFLFVDRTETVSAAENWRSFIKGLSEKKQYDTVIEYLTSSYKKEDCPDDLREEYFFQLGKARLGLLSNASETDMTAKITECKKTFTQFLEAQPKNDRIFEACYDLARLELFESNLLFREASQTSGSETAKLAIRSQARSHLEQAELYLKRAIESGSVRIKKLQEKVGNNKSNVLDEVQGIFLNARIIQAALPAERAKTRANDSEEYKKDLHEAYDNLQSVYEKYQQYTGALTARFRQAQIAFQLENYEDADSILAELAVLPMEPAFYQLKTDVLNLRFQYFQNDDSEENFNQQIENILKLLKEFDDWKNKSPISVAQYESSVGQQIHLSTAKLLLKIMEIRSKKGAELQKILRKSFETETKMSKALISPTQTPVLTKQLLEFVAQLAGPLSLEADELLKSPLLGVNKSNNANTSPKNDAKNANNLAKAKKAWLAYLRAYRKDQSQSTAETKENLKTIAEQSEIILKNCSESEDESISAEDLAQIRLNLATLLYMSEKYIDSVRLTNKLCRSDEFKDAPKAAEIALYALKKLFAQYKNDTSEKGQKILAAVEKLTAELTGLIIKRWSTETTGAGAVAAREAVLLRIDNAIKSNDVQHAEELLKQIPDASPWRATAELRFGQALWAEYVQKINSTDKEDETNAEKENGQKELSLLLEAARNALNSGLTRIISNSKAHADDITAVYSALALAQIYMTGNDYENALKWLTHPVIGPFLLVETTLKDDKRTKKSDQQNSALNSEKPNESGKKESAEQKGDSQNKTDENNANEDNTENDKEDSSEEDVNADPLLDNNFQMTTLLLMLRIHIAAGKINEAENILAIVEKCAGDEKDEERLTAIYIQLGRRLEEQLRQIGNGNVANSGANQKNMKNDLAKGFENLLDKISQKENGNTYSSLHWVADTYMSMARGLGGSSFDGTVAAKTYYTKSGRTWQTILKKIKADPNWAKNPKAELVASVRMAECLRGTGRFDKALTVLQPVIAANANNLDLQIEAAKIYQSWGILDQEYFVRAILGGLPNSKGINAVWGWNQIISRLSRSIDKNPRFKEVFYEAWLNKILCRYQYLRRIDDANARQKEATDAVREITRLKQIHPDLGGPENQRKINDQIKRIQRVLDPSTAETTKK